MINVRNITVNGNVSSDTETPIVAGTNPTIKWEFFSDRTDIFQEIYEYRIGTSDNNWGFTNYEGDIDEQIVQGGGNHFYYSANNLQRGITYYGQIRAVDNESQTGEWVQFSFKLNQLPFVLNSRILPNNPTTITSLEIDYFYFDPDNQTEKNTKLRWYKNNVHQPDFDNICTVPATSLNPGDDWSAKIIPCDGLEFGQVTETLAVTIGSTDLGIENVKIIPEDANIDDLLKVQFDISDEYLFLTEEPIIEWFVNNTIVQNGTVDTLRTSLDAGDSVYAIIKVLSNNSVVSQATSNIIIISDVKWHIENLTVDGLSKFDFVSNLTPIIEWDIYKSKTRSFDRPTYLRVIVTKTPSTNGAIYDSGHKNYGKNSFTIPDGVLKRGQKYYLHVSITDSTEEDNFTTKQLLMTGSGWSDSVSNKTGWTVECKVSVEESSIATYEPNLGIYIHDGTYFATIIFGLNNITVVSSSRVSYPLTDGNLTIPKTFRVSGKNKSLKVYMDNKLIIDMVNQFSHESQLKLLEYGDIDPKNTNSGSFKFFRYSTDGAVGIDSSISESTFYFNTIGQLQDGSIDYIKNDLIAWLPSDTDESVKLIKHNENSEVITLPTVSRNYSPITSIFIDNNRNKFFGTANGVTAIYGEKHTADYTFDTSSRTTVSVQDFDKISNLSEEQRERAEGIRKSGWFTLDTTYRSVGRSEVDIDAYDPYSETEIFKTHAIHYYSQRAHGHRWYDYVNNKKGWSARFGFQANNIEADSGDAFKTYSITAKPANTDIVSKYIFDDNTLYRVIQGTDYGYFTYNLSTLDATVEESLPFIPLTTALGITFDSIRGVMLSVDTTNNTLVSFDPISGDIINSVSISSQISSVEFTKDFGLFGLDKINYKLYRVNPETAEITLVGRFHRNTTDYNITAIAYDQNAGTMYGFSSSVDRYYTIDLNTASVNETVSDGSWTFGSAVDFASFGPNTGVMFYLAGSSQFRYVDFSTNTHSTLSTGSYPFSGYGGIFAPDGPYFVHNPDWMRIGNYVGANLDAYLALPVNIPANSVVESAYLNLKAFSENQSAGTSLSVVISAVDPSSSDIESLNIDSGLAYLNTTVSWTPSSWNADETISVNITELIQAVVDSTGYTPTRRIIFKIKTTSDTPESNYRVFYAGTSESNKPSITATYRNTTKKDGFGIYVNDGERQEIIFLYDDKIRLYYANVFVPINNSIPRLFSVVAKDNNIKIYHKLASTAVGSYQLLLDGSGLFTTPASKAGNSQKPKTLIDNLGTCHVVWHDDGNRRSQIFYSKNDGSWSTPEEVTIKTQFSLKNPEIDIDSKGRLWVVYEDTSFGYPEICCSVRDSIGWNTKIRITNFSSDKRNPKIKIDGSDNAHIVWEDNRNGNYQIYWCEWDNEKQAWLSSGQFGIDTPITNNVVVTSIEDPYIGDPYINETNDTVSYHNPALSFIDDKIFLVYEKRLLNANSSSIYIGFRDTVRKYWNVEGSQIFTDNVFVGTGTSVLVSAADGNNVNPTVSALETNVIVYWENPTDLIPQIYGRLLDTYLIYGTDVTQITNSPYGCSNPSSGFIRTNCAVVYESNNNINFSYFDRDNMVFKGSGVDSLSVITDDAVLLDTTNRSVKNPSIPPYSPVSTTKLVFDFIRDRDPYDIQSVESPDFRLIGSIDVLHETANLLTSTTADFDETVSLLDTKEFAFGDFSENIGVNANWKDIEFYFGYDARPHSISKFNSSTVNGWPDNRINDLFVDAYGNIVAATFGGLVYHNTSLGKTTIIEGHTVDFDATKTCLEQSDKCLLLDKIVTSVKWAKNGIWYVGTTEGCYYTRNAGRTWYKLFEDALGTKVINAIVVDKHGQAVIATSSAGVFVAHPDMASPVEITTPNLNIICVAVDDNDVIWCGSETGLFRVENYHTIIEYNINNGMRSSHVNDITIVNNNLRYLATATGVERMYGSFFNNINAKSNSLINNNIASVSYVAETNSLWIGSLYVLHEIVFRDPEHNIINNEVVHYDTAEISTKEMYDKNIFYILDFDKVQTVESSSLLDSESAYVYLNKNKLAFGYTIDSSTKSITFDTDLLINDNVEIQISNKFVLFHDFNQSAIEKSVKGIKRQSITKIDTTSRNQTLFLSGLDKPSLLLYTGVSSDLPFATILLDRDNPRGCIEKIDNLTPTKLRFKLLAFEQLSGIDGYILSNYENFTTDGATPQDYTPFTQFVEHELNEGLSEVIESIEFDDTVTIDNVEYSIGTGNFVEKWSDTTINKEWLFAVTSSPVVIYKFDPETNKWTAIQTLNNNNDSYFATGFRNVNNILYLTLGTTNSSNSGLIYRSVNGTSFDLVGTVVGTIARGIAGSISGDVFIGTNLGTIYRIRENNLSIAYENIGESIYSCDVFNNTLLVATGTKGRLYSIDIGSGNNIIIFAGSDQNLNNVHIKDPLLSTSSSGVDVFTSSNNTSTIYRGDLEGADYKKSYSTFGKNITKILTVDTSIFDPSIAEAGTITVAAVGDTLFKFEKPSWKFVYKHSEEIRDIVQYKTNDIDGIWVISDSKINKWTSTPKSKTVFLRLRDKAGNISDAPVVSNTCPTEENTVCCNYAYSINISDLQDFIHEGKLIDVASDGSTQFSFSSPNKRLIYSGDRIDEEVGIYTSEVFNGSNDLVSWKSIQWESSEPTGTSLEIQIRSGETESAIEDENWTTITSETKNVRIDFITNQYIQFRVLLKSKTRGTSPSLSSVTLRNITAQASHFFTTNFILPSKPIKGLLTTNTFIPVTADIIFGVNTSDSVDFSDYQVIEPNRLFTVANGQIGSNLRIGAKLLSPGIFRPEESDPYLESPYVCIIDFDFSNHDSQAHEYQFRARFYNDPNRTHLIHEFYTGNDQTGWSIGTDENSFPSTGLYIASSGSANIRFSPTSVLESNQKWYITIDSWNGESFDTVIERTYICSSCYVTHEEGLVADYYNTGLDSNLDQLPNFSSYTPDLTLLDDQINFPAFSGTWITSQNYNTGMSGRMAIRWRGKIQIPVSGTYTFKLTSTDGSQLIIDQEVVIDNNQAGDNAKESEVLDLDAGFHSIEVLYFRSDDTGEIILEWTLPTDGIRTVVPASKLFHQIINEYCENTSIPKLFNLGILFELEDGSSVKINQ